MIQANSKIRIGVFTKQLDHWTSGSGHHLNQIMWQLIDLITNRSDIELTFIHYKRSENPIYNKVRELIVPRNPLLSIRVLRKEKFDLVHYTPLTIYAPIWMAPNKKVATIHGVEQLLIPQFFGPFEMFHERVLVPIYARKMDGIFTVSNKTKNYLVEYFHVQSDRITVAYNGISKEYRPRSIDELDALKKYQISRPYVYHISRFSERKNPWILLTAFKKFLSNDAHRPHFLVCAGKGWDSAEVRNYAIKLNISERLITPGFVSEIDSAQLMAGADLFLFPTLAEGFGIPNIEAMAAGCPVVTTAAFAVPEIVGDAAIVVQDPYDSSAIAESMADIVDNKKLREELIQKGLKRVESGIFSWQKAAEKLLELYERVMKS